MLSLPSDRCCKKSSDRSRRGRFDFDSAQVTDSQDYRYLESISEFIAFCLPNLECEAYGLLFMFCDHSMFVATWNVGGKSPPSYLNLEDWLHSSPPADIYVLG